jgi:hypothetical protein
VLDRVLRQVSALDAGERLELRYQKFRSMGRLGIDFVDEDLTGNKDTKGTKDTEVRGRPLVR